MPIQRAYRPGLLDMLDQCREENVLPADDRAFIFMQRYQRAADCVRAVRRSVGSGNFRGQAQLRRGQAARPVERCGPDRSIRLPLRTEVGRRE